MVAGVEIPGIGTMQWYTYTFTYFSDITFHKISQEIYYAKNDKTYSLLY